MDWAVRLFSEPGQIPVGQGGVYLLFVEDALDYVGQSEDVYRRLAVPHHVYAREVHTLIAFVHEENYETRLGLERYFNHKYDPPNSFIGTGKQSDRHPEWHHTSAEKRRRAWPKRKFEEFPLDKEAVKKETVLELSQLQFTDNVMGVPSIVVLKPKDARKR